uniref:Uncharacterized protein n=1 Tax=Pundamilia nyererei TaxID=303518 RepID=A0A3B4FSD2_9CICH
MFLFFCSLMRPNTRFWMNDSFILWSSFIAFEIRWPAAIDGPMNLKLYEQIINSQSFRVCLYQLCTSRA